MRSGCNPLRSMIRREVQVTDDSIVFLNECRFFRKRFCLDNLVQTFDGIVMSVLVSENVWNI